MNVSYALLDSPACLSHTGRSGSSGWAVLPTLGAVLTWVPECPVVTLLTTCSTWSSGSLLIGSSIVSVAGEGQSAAARASQRRCIVVCRCAPLPRPVADPASTG